jgi:hemolysin activation/secretion protein
MGSSLSIRTGPSLARARLGAVAVGAATALALVPAAWVAAMPGAEVLAAPGDPDYAYASDAVVVEYGNTRNRSTFPAITELGKLEVELGRAGDIFTSRGYGGDAMLRIAEIGLRPGQRLTGGALFDIADQLVAELNRRGFPDVLVRPNPADIDPANNRDLRGEGNRTLRLQVWLGVIEELADTPLPGAPYRVSDLSVDYAERYPNAPALSGVLDLEVDLVAGPNGLTSPRRSAGDPMKLRLSQIGAPGLPLTESAVRDINATVVDELTKRGLAGVFVQPNTRDIDPSSKRDLRPDEERGLRLAVYLGRVTELRTYAAGERVPQEAAVDNPVHERIKQLSPLQATEGDLLRIDEIEDYVAWLNRHPGRRVDVSLAKSLQAGGVALDFTVTENKPWATYVQIGDTGTDRTSEYRQRVGFSHTQLTGRDDVLQLDYITGGFDQLNGMAGFYEAPVGMSRHLRWRVFARASEFEAEFNDLGGVLPFDITGERYDVGGELRANLLQRGKLFVDMKLGARYMRAHVDNEGGQVDASDNFLLPGIGLLVERRSDLSLIQASLDLEGNVGSLAGTDVDSRDGSNTFDKAGGLGRQDPDEDWLVARWDMTLSTYLDPVFDPAAFADPNRPTRTPAHELSLRVFGQYAFENRLIPQEQLISGGLYTVRGYDQSIAAGDSVYMGSLEYRFHIPRALPIRRTVDLPLLGSFKVTPQQPGGRPDWDLIFRMFVDAARVQLHDRTFFEQNQQLLSAGAGLELQVWRNLAVRLDVGFPLDSGSRRANGERLADRRNPIYHFGLTSLY